MRTFSDAYPGFVTGTTQIKNNENTIVQQTAAQLQELTNQSNIFVQQLIVQLINKRKSHLQNTNGF